MKLRYLATVVVLALILIPNSTTVAAHAQNQQTVQQPEERTAQGNFGLYLNPIAIRVSNANADSGPFAFLGEKSTSNVFYGYNLGGFYDLYHSGKLGAGMEMRFSDLHANNAMLKNFLIGARISGQPFSRPLKPYVMLGVGSGSTKAPNSTVHVKKLDYGVFAGVDYTLGRHVDWRVFELGYGSLVTVSTATVGAGGPFPTTSSQLINFSSGLVFRF